MFCCCCHRKTEENDPLVPPTPLTSVASAAGNRFRELKPFFSPIGPDKLQLTVTGDGKERSFTLINSSATMYVLRNYLATPQEGLSFHLEENGDVKVSGTLTGSSSLLVTLEHVDEVVTSLSFIAKGVEYAVTKT